MRRLCLKNNLQFHKNDIRHFVSVIVEEAAEVLEQHIVTSLTRNTQHLILIGMFPSLYTITLRDRDKEIRAA